MSQQTKPNSQLQCCHCKSEQRVNFGRALKAGWPECCGETMMLVSHTADIGAEVRRTMNEQLHAVAHKKAGG